MTWPEGLHSCCLQLCQSSCEADMVVKPREPGWRRAEKNWAFFEHQGRLLFFYSMLPCSLIYQFDPASPNGAVLRHAYCYSEADEVCQHATYAVHINCRVQQQCSMTIAISM